MKKLLLAPVFFLFVFVAQSQNLICVQSGSNASFYADMQTAYDNSQTNDNIYLYGGNHYLSAFDKPVHIYGTGTFTDSSLVTGISILSIANVTNNANGGSIEGVSLYITMGDQNSTDTISDLCFIRCIFNTGIFFRQTFNNILFRENVILAGDGGCGWCGNYFSVNGNFINSYFNNNIITDDISGGNNINYTNNLFIACGNGGTYQVSYNSFYYNNAFVSGSPYISGTGSLYSNNLNIPNGDFGTTQSFGNVTEDVTLAFINPGVLSGNCYSYSITNNYQLQNGSLCNNAGADGTDIGLYGGSGRKAGSIPVNPHISSKLIGTQTDANGSLPVNIKVAAQSY